MSRYLEKYKGTYRVKAFYDLKTNDYPRICKNGMDMIDPSFDDLYIPCKSKNYIMHYQGSILMAVVSTVSKGHNIIKQLYEDKYGESTSTGIAYDDLYNQLIKENIIIKVEETDKEMLIYFSDIYMKKFAEFFKPQVNGAKSSVFSTRNLPKQKYIIPDEDLQQYKNIICKLENKLDVRRYNSEFLDSLEIDYKKEMKLIGLKGKEYIHYINMWEKYLEFLKMKIC